MSIVLEQSLAGLTLGVFTLNATLVYLTSVSSEKSMKWLYPFSLSFVTLALAEYVFVLDHLDTGFAAVPWLNSFAHLRLVQDLLYLIAGTSMVFYLREVRREKNV